MGVPFAFCGVAAAWHGWCGFTLGILIVIAAPYTFLTTRWPVWNDMMIHRFTSSRAFAKCSMQQDPTHPIDFEGESPVLLAYSPHGVFCAAFSGSHGVLHPLLFDKGVVFLLASFLYHMPLFRLFVVALFGNVRDASRGSMESLMTERRHVALLPGGLEEASIVEPGRERVYVRRRKGFVKLALRYGYTIYPIYTFGESEAYRTFVPAWLPFALRWRINSWKLPVAAPWGRWWAPLMPLAGAELHTVVGRPIKCPRTDEKQLRGGPIVDEYHRRYVAELLRVFDEQKAKFGREHARLEIY